MLRLIKRVIRAVYVRLKLLMRIIIYTVCRVIPAGKKGETWVICERGVDARDNGYAFYRYVADNHLQIRLHYLIDPASADYPKVAAHAVAYGSLKNYWVAAHADKIISTHCYLAIPGLTERVWHMLGLHRRFCFLQHGIIQSRLPYLFGDRTRMRLFCCAGRPEYEYLKENFRHPQGVVQCTGFARYDQLLPFETKKQILVMPTWRRYLKDERAFLDSTYYAAWNALLSDQRLIDYLEKTGTQLLFYPHYEMQSKLLHFSSSSPCVVLADFAHYDVQQLLKESQLLITDYSSVYFDFAYMQKPIVYYQFDDEEYHRQHYQEGYFDFSLHGFGDVVRTQDAVVNSILRSAGNGFRMEELYCGRTQTFFAYRDRDNCRRIFDAVIGL